MSTTTVEQRHSARRAFLALSTCLAAGLATPAMAQLQSAAPIRESVDRNGVDLFLGTINIKGPVLSIGQADQGIQYHAINRGTGWGDNLIATKSGNNIHLGAKTDRFTLSNGIYTNTEGNGSSLTYNATLRIFTYISADGTVARFDENNGSRALDIKLPNGTKLTYFDDLITYCAASKPPPQETFCTWRKTDRRAGGLRSSYGYVVNFLYGDPGEYDPEDSTMQPDIVAWSTRTGDRAAK